MQNNINYKKVHNNEKIKHYFDFLRPDKTTVL